MKKAALFGLLLGYATVIFDTTALSVALPSIGDSFGERLGLLQWVVNSYVIGFAGFLLFSGKLSDRFGSRLILLWGVWGFSVFSLGCAAAVNIEMLITMRFFQGIFAAFIASSSFALAAKVATSSAERARYISMLNLCATVGLAGGFVLGGVFSNHLSWRWIFLANMGIAAIVLFGTRTISSQESHLKIHIDVVGQVLGVVALTSLAGFFIEGADVGWSAPITVICGLIFTLSISAFIIAERTSKTPMVPVSLFLVPSFRSGAIGILTWRFSFYGLMFMLSIYFQGSFGYSPDKAGLSLLPLMVAMSIGNALVSPCIKRFGVRNTVKYGYIGCAMGAVLLTVSAPHGYFPIMASVMLIAITAGTGVPALGHAYINDVPQHQMGFASGVYNATGQTGMLIGVAVLGGLVSLDGARSLEVTGFMVAIVLSVATVSIFAWLHPEREKIVESV